MKKRYRLLTVALVLLVVPSMTFSANRQAASSESSKKKPDTSAVQQRMGSTKETPNSGQTGSTTVNPASGEQIKWQVLSGGGGASSSTNFKLSATVGQTAAGPTASTNFKLNQGFWQSFTTNCCIGKRGNVNMAGGIDLSDLSALVSYLTGGSFVPTCTDAANVNGAGGVDLSDLSSLVSYLTGGTFQLVNCP